MGSTEDRGVHAGHRTRSEVACCECGARMDQAGRDGDVPPASPTISSSGPAGGPTAGTTESAVEHGLQRALPDQGPAVLLSVDGSGLVQSIHHRLPGSENDLVRADL